MKSSPFALARIGASLGGRRWYHRARWSILDYCDRTGGLVTPGEVADLLSLYSPRVPVARSVRLALHHIRTGGPHGSTLPSVAKSVAHWEITGTIRGPKTAAFAAALRGDGTACVVDTWMFKAYGLSPSRPNLRSVERRIRSMAGRLGWPVAEAQAALWRGVRLAHNRVPSELTIPC